MIKKITLTLFLLIGCLFNQKAIAQLNTGDIVFVAFRFDGNDQDGNCEDGFAFAALVDIPANTTIYFTEDESNGTGFITGEGSISWVHNEIVEAGTVVDIVTHVQSASDYCGGTNPTPTANIGTVQFEGATGSWTISTTAEEIYAYLGAVQAPTTWLTALWTDNSDNSNTLPAALNGFLLDFTNVDQDTDLGILTAGTDCPDRATCLANALNLDNWTTENETGADCCDDNGVNYPADIPSTLGACIQPTITGIDVITCAAPGELSTFQVNGELNGAEHWTWYFGSCDEEPTSAPLNLGNEFTFAFFPIFHDSTFIVRAEGGCADVGAACFEYTPNTLFGPTSFTALEDLCSSEGVQSGLGSGTPSGGTYSGSGVTDDGNGMTYSFDPSVAGAGMHEISYTNDCGWSVTDMVEVFAAEALSFSATNSFDFNDFAPGTAPSGLGTVSPTGGTFSGIGIIDDGNGMTFSIDPSTFMDGANYTATYSFTNANNCMSSATADIAVSASTVTLTGGDNLCVDAGTFAGVSGGMPAGGVYSGPGVTDDGNGMTYTFDSGAAGVGIHTITYTKQSGASASIMVEVYDLPAVSLSLEDTILVDLSMPLVNFPGTGMPVGGVYDDQFGEITDDGNGSTFSFDTLVIGLNVIFYTYTDPLTGCENTTSDTIRLLIDPATSIDEVDQNLNFEVFPNPTNGQLQLVGIPVDDIQIIDALGKKVIQRSNPGFSLDISTLPSGIYFLQAHKDKRFKTIRIIKE